MSCTATLTTASDSGKHVTVHTLTCVDTDCGTQHRNDIHGKTLWRDDTPGASPHVEPLVTEAVVDWAWAEWMNSPLGADGRTEMRKILEGVALDARVRKEGQA